MTKTVLNVEADEIVYRAAFAVQRSGYIITTKNGNTKDLADKYTKTKLIKMLREKNKELNIDYTLERYVITEPVQHCLRIIHNTLKRLEKFGELQLWLSPSDHSNFRYGIAKTPGSRGEGYKAGRPDRPVYYKEAREYIIKRGAKEVKGYEADDALGLYQDENSIAVHIDKDINMVPGKHLNWVKMEFYECPSDLGTVELVDNKIVGRGRKFFYHQLLTGDATDNIPGLPGVGDKTAYTLLRGLETEEECKERVVETYYGKLGKSKETLLRLEEVANLLWIVQEEGVIGQDILYTGGMSIFNYLDGGYV